MDLELADRRVLITGASRGIGYATAAAFLRQGARVAVTARTPVALEAAATRLGDIAGGQRVLARTFDCADAVAWGKTLAHIDAAWGGLDIVVANAGDGRGPTVPLPDAHRFATAWRSNFTVAEESARATLPLLQASHGCLLFVSSIAGREAIGAPTDYSVAKAAVIALTKQLARRLAPAVRVNCLAPGNVHFPGGAWDEKMQADPARVEAFVAATVPMRRFADPDEIADAALFLCSARARFITGACLVVDGGQTVGM